MLPLLPSSCVAVPSLFTQIVASPYGLQMVVIWAAAAASGESGGGRGGKTLAQKVGKLARLREPSRKRARYQPHVQCHSEVQAKSGSSRHMAPPSLQAFSSLLPCSGSWADVVGRKVP